MEHIKQLVDAYIKGEGITKDTLIKTLGMSRSGYYAKMGGLTPWDLDEAARLSGLLGITIDEFAAHVLDR